MCKVWAAVVGVAGLLALVGGVVWAEIDMASMTGPALVGLGALLLVAAATLCGVKEGLDALTRHRHAGHP
ncbi:hypothetical protein ACI789_02235 [Geodermatophilus sp. SYSU D00965]